MQVLGFGWAGIFRRYLVEPAAMWWPSNLVQVSLFRTLHEKRERSKEELTRIQFFIIVTTCSFTYYIFPDYLFKMLTSLSCKIWTTAILVIIFYLFFLDNVMTCIYLGKKREIWEQARASCKEGKWDIHTKLMSGYKQVPQWWFWVILVVNIGAAIFVCGYYNDHLQLPWWGVLLACLVSFIFVLPIGVITAVTNQFITLNVLTEYIIGYLYPGYPVANMCFKVYGEMSMAQAIVFLQDLKLGHYMKIPPRNMFMAQILGTLIAVVVYLGTAWWLLETIPDICESSSSIWTCPSDTVFYDSTVIWGLIGPRRIFGNQGTYTAINWFFLGGAIGPIIVWLAHKAFPEKKWIRLINMPVVIGATGRMPPATAVNFTTWIFVGFLSGFVVYRYRPNLWNKYNYVLSGGLEAGLAFMGILLYFCLGMEGITLDWWGNDLDGCSYATCPTAKGVKVDGCPVF